MSAPADPSPVVKARQVNLRSTYEEEAAVQGALSALGSDLTASAFVGIALYQAVTDLGMLLGDDEPPRLKPGYVWPFEPRRPDGVSARSRVVLYLPELVYPTVEAAAWAVRLSVPLFAIGSSLRYIALLKLANERRKKQTPTTYNPALAKVAVPYDLDELVRSTRR